MAINMSFLTALDEHVVLTTRALKITSEAPLGALSVTDQQRFEDLHVAASDLLNAVSSLQNWAYDVTREIERLGGEVTRD